MDDFKPQLILFDEEGYNIATKQAEAKLKALNDAKNQCEQYISVDNLKAFESDIIAYFKQKISDTSKDFLKLGISVDKIIDLKEINLQSVNDIAEAYYSMKGDIQWSDDNTASITVDKAPYQKFTKNEEQNKTLAIVKDFINSVEKLKAFNGGVRIGGIAMASGGAVIGDIRTNSLRINPSLFT